jgi:vacuolar-type H+-ATPase subunit H
MDALHLIRSAAESADTLESDAQQASSNQLARTEEEVSRRQHELQDREAEIERYRQESERQRAEITNAARNEARELLQNAERDVSQEVRESEARATRLVEQARHQATELTNAARAEVEQTLEWARAQAATIMARAQQGAEQFLASAGLGESEIARVAESIVRAADHESGGGRQPGSMPSTQPDTPEPSGPIPVRPSARKSDDEPASPKTPPADDGEREEPKP